MDLRSRYAIVAGATAAIALGLALLTAPLAAQEETPIGGVVLVVDGIIGPASMDFIVRGIDKAESAGSEILVVKLNTPGGLDSSTRAIISRILASDVPVVTYVAPSGSRAASAGTYILYASHVAAMAPATNLGSATPVTLAPGGVGGDDRDRRRGQRDGEDDDEEDSGPDERRPAPGSAMQRKVINDSVAYIKGLARLRGRNEEWAERAVREAVNLTAEDALEENVIDVVADDLPDLLAQIDGRVVELEKREVTLATAALPMTTVEPDWRTKFLAVITNPNVACILMLLGIYGLFFELSNPGAIIPGVLGGISILLALYAFQVLPINYAGVALILLGIAFIVGEMFVPSFGALGIGGAVAFIVGSIILIDTDIEALKISLPLIAAVAVLTAMFTFTLITLAIRQRRRPVVSGREELLGSEGEAVVDFDGEGRVHIHGEQWAARTDEPVRRGQRVTVRDIDGLTLVIEPVKETP